MTDTATKSTTAAKTTRKAPRPRDVKYGEDIGIGPIDQLPPKPARSSELNRLVETQTKDKVGQFVAIVSYVDGGIASATATTLRKRYPLSDGYDFASRKTKDGRSVVFAQRMTDEQKKVAIERQADKDARRAAKASK